jgi:exonuclease VII large subunit
LWQARNEQDEGPQGSSDAVVLNSWATERQRLQEEVESLRELLREGDEAHDRDIEQLRKSLTQRQRDADDMLQREQERSNRLEKALDEALAQQRTRTRVHIPPTAHSSHDTH